MSNFDRGPVSVASREVHGPSFGMGTLGLVAVLALGAGTILGGVIMPFLRSAPPDQSQTQKVEAAQQTNRALLFSMYPQTIYAPILAGGEPISTGMSVEQYLTELEVRASQSGLSSSKLVERRGDSVDISYAFSDKVTDDGRTFPQSKVRITHPKTLVLTFASGPLPGTIALVKARVDGRDRGTGESFVDFISLGSTLPQLSEGQFLTARGVFEIKLTGTGVGAFLDGVLVYPAAPPKPGPILAFPGQMPRAAPLSTQLPRRLALQSFQPAIGPIKDRMILVASTTATDTCSAKAVILDVKRGTLIELPEPLLTPEVAVTNAKDALVFNGFCVPGTVGSLPELAPKPTSELAAAPKSNVRVSARYDLTSGALTWQRETIAVVPTAPVSALVPQVGPSTPWRAQGDTRLASPLVSGGALVSVACRPGGGVTIAVSGLPAPADSQAASIRFVANGGSAVSQMRWRASAAGYELDSAGRPNEARAILDRLRAGGIVTISGAGGSKTVPAPGRAQIDPLVRTCGAASVAPSGAAVLSGAALARPSVAIVKTKPKPAPVAPAATVQLSKAVVKAVPPRAASPTPPRAMTAAPKPKPKPVQSKVPAPAPEAVAPRKE